MKTQTAVVVVVFAAFLPVSGCRQTTEPPPVGGFELLTNTSFEFLGVPTLQYWHPQDTTLLHFSKDTPPGGGTWAIRIATTWFPGYAILQFVPADPGTHRYQLSCWSKGQGVTGGFWLSVKYADSVGFRLRKAQAVIDSVWTSHTLIDTITTSLGDSLLVGLGGGATEIAGGMTYFDLCELVEVQGN